MRRSGSDDAAGDDAERGDEEEWLPMTEPATMQSEAMRRSGSDDAA
jgi:hypothetical protein